MSSRYKELAQLYRRVGMIVLTPLLHLTGFFARAFRLGNRVSPIMERYGYVLLQQHYYLGIPAIADQVYTTNPSEMVGVKMNDDQAQLALIEQIITPYQSELAVFPIEQTDEGFYWTNGSFMAGDAHFYYGMIRHYQPQRIIEIGSGFSTAIATAALKHNPHPGELICIEPYPRPVLKATKPEITTLIESKVQEVSLDLFRNLRANDILFIDSTHVLKMGSDVWWEYCEILPRLASGVWVHIHDISLPYHYPDVYFKNHYHWNEQYLLQALLTYSDHFEVVWAGTYLNRKYSEQVRLAFMPYFDKMRQAYPRSEPASMWLRVR